ncbi:FkbM family methyltransferase [Helicobacter didelphidarum]|uniref:FkbM family methyltransferase n=1 Tax=Helicobacter didelphidarum TaxID=2040648 RepID=A0A3D8IR60_9HELI|nr:FkbM family methyltransferase [Helicobacter didelphidarum]RDU67593.1 FkbM family methyltransferase [Helicobacter didelphidarum]
MVFVFLKGKNIIFLIICGGGGYTQYTYKVLNTFTFYKSKQDLCILNRVLALLDIWWLQQIQGAEFHGQLGQDIIAYTILKHKKHGFFVDIAAHDGISSNNTLLFERLGWNGFCVEANPETFKKLQQNRKCDCYNKAVFSKNIGITRFATTSADFLDTLEITMTKNHKERMENVSSGNVKYIEVQTITFNELMANYPDVTHIDFMSLDVEGGELEVLKGIDFDKYTFGVMTIEHNYVQSRKMDIINLLHDKGYRILFENNFDIMFVRNERIGFVAHTAI